MSNINLALDDIIAKTKKTNKKTVGSKKPAKNPSIYKQSEKINMSLADIIAKNKISKKSIGPRKSARSQSISKKSAKTAGRKIGGGIERKNNVGKGRTITKTVVPSGKKEISDINLSLDDIIAKNKIIKNAGPKKSAKNQNVSNKSSKNQIQKSPNSARKVIGEIQKTKIEATKKINEEVTKIEPTPSPKWIKNAVCIRTFAVPVLNTNQIVRVNVSNLPATVNTADLQEIFSAYSTVSASVHYGDNKEHLGTGELNMKKNDAMKALSDMKGIAVDGSPLSFAIVARGAGRSIFYRVQMAEKVTGGAIQKRSGPQQNRTVKKVIGKRQPSKKSVKGNRNMTKKQPMNEEELNAELDSYMARPAIGQ